MNCRNNSTALLRRTSRWCKMALLGAGFALIGTQAGAQVSVTATGVGPGPTVYGSLNAAFTAINAGTHQGAITCTITADYSEPAVAVPLLASGTGSSNYTSIAIRPSGNRIVSSNAAPTASRGVIEIQGADNVTIDGDDPGTGGTRNLTFQAAAVTTTGVAVIRFASTSTTNGATNCTIKNCIVIGSRNSTTSSVTNYGIYSGTAVAGSTSTSGQSDNNDNLTIENNEVRRCYWGIYVAGTTANVCDNLIIRNNIVGSATAADNVANRGIYIQNTQLTAGAASAIVEGNDVRTAQPAATSTNDITAIEVASGNAGALIRSNNIHDVQQAAAGGRGAFGIWVTGSTSNAGVTISNNFIRDVTIENWSASQPPSGSDLPAGIYVSVGATGLKIYHNSISMNVPNLAPGTAGWSACLAITSTGATGSDIRNNIFSNTQTGAAGSFFYDVFVPSGFTFGTINGNDYHVTVDAIHYVGYNGATRLNLAAWQGATLQDGGSKAVNPAFTSTTDLHIPAATASELESAGVSGTGITTDIDGNVRPGPAGSVNGGMTANDIGADEFDGIPVDLTGPSISYTALSNTCSLLARSLSATITDASGVPTAGAGLPVLYWRIQPSLVYTAATATHGGGSTYNFSFGAGVVAGNVVEYYIAAQDNAGTPNLSANPSGGASGPSANPPAYSTHPTTPSSYTIQSTLAAGTYLIPTNYATITAAVADYNTKCLGGAIVFEIESSYTGAGETFPITINANADASAINTLTIRPGAGVTNSISGTSTTAIIVLNGADYVTINGSNNPLVNSCCPVVASTRNLTIANANTAAAVIQIQSNGANGATNNSVRNCILFGGSVGTGATYGVFSGSSTLGNAATAANNNTVIENNDIRRVRFGIMTIGVSAAAKNTGTQITQNVMNNVSPNHIGDQGINVQFDDGATISCNNIANLATAGTTNDCIGINVGGVAGGFTASTTTSNEVTNATITKNQIGNFTATSTYSVAGVWVGTAATGTTTVANNMIYQMNSNGTFGDMACGIWVGGGAQTTRVYYNTVDMNRAALTGGSQASSALAIAGSNPIVDVKNNILTSTGSTGANLNRAISSLSSTITNLSSDYNDLHVTGTGSQIAMTGSLVGPGTTFTFATWQAVPKDANGKNVAPVYVSATDLHLDNTNASNIANLSNTGTVVAVTDDIDCATRGATPSIGADHFVAPSCSGTPAGGTSTLGAGPYCAGGTFSMSNTGASSGLGITYQWQTGPTGGPYTNVVGGSGATTTSYTTGTLTAGTYYYVLKVKCSTGPDSTLSNEVALTVNALPSVGVSPVPANAAICGGVGNVVITASGASTYTWLPNTALAPNNTSNPVTATPSTTTTYTVTGTDGNGCTNTATQVVNVGPNPTMGTPTATPATVCFDGSSTLNATGSVPGYTQGVGGSSFIDISATGTVLADAGTPIVVDDDSEHPLTIPSFTFNGTAYTSALVGNNGTLIFTTATSGNMWYTNLTLPTGTAASDNAGGIAVAAVGNVALCPWWDDLTDVATTSIRYQTVGNLFIVQWTDEDHFSASGSGTVTFQLQLDLVTGKIYFAYGDVDFSGSAAQDKGGSATVGLNYSNTAGVLSSFNTQSLTNTTVISYTPNVPTFDWSPVTYLDDATNNASPIASLVQSTETYTVTGTSPIGCTATATVTLTMQPAADAGDDDAVSYCENSDTNDLSLLVTGDGGGTWPDGGPNYDATTQSPGVYRYVVAGVSPCPNDTAFFTVGEQVLPNAGSPGTALVCINGSSFALVDSLGGTPDGGGSWTDPSLNPHSGTFVPGTDAAGVYTYTVNAIAPCSGSVTATVTVSYDNTDTDGDAVIDCLDNCPTVFGVQGDACDVNGPLPGFILGALNGSCTCVATPCTENVTLEMRAGSNGDSQEIGWEILSQNVATVICSGGTHDIPPTPYLAGVTTPITETCCLPAGCYRLRVHDSGGDGFIVGGGYQLRETAGQQRRIIDNLPKDGTDNSIGNFNNGSLSALANTFENGAFCVPLGDVKPIFSSCDKLDWTNYRFIVASEDAAVSAEFDVTPPIVQPTNSGYEFWFFDPNGTYSYRRFRSHATTDGFGSGATRACHFKINKNVPLPPGNQSLNQEIPYNTLLNVRIRGRVNGNNLPFGPACLFKIDPALAFCPLVKLQDNPADADFSCGVINKTFGGPSQPSNRITANPPYGPAMTPPTPVVRYQFRFRIDAEGICIVRPPQASAQMVMNWNVAPATPTQFNSLRCGSTYQVDVRISRDGGATWCTGAAGSSQAAACSDLSPWGKVCSVTINTSTYCPPPLQGGGSNSLALQSEGGLTMYPNPNRGDQVRISLSSVDADVNTVSVDIFDLSGKKVTSRAIPVQDGMINTELKLNGDLAGGMYLVNITAGTKTYTERLVIQP